MNMGCLMSDLSAHITGNAWLRTTPHSGMGNLCSPARLSEMLSRSSVTYSSEVGTIDCHTAIFCETIMWDYTIACR